VRAKNQGGGHATLTLSLNASGNRMRKLWIIPLALLLVVPIAVFSLLSMPAVLVKALHWGTAAFTDYRLEVQGLQVSPAGMSGRFDTLSLYPQDSDGPALITVLAFEGRSRFADLWHTDLEATSLKSSSIVVYVSADDDNEDPTPAQWLQYLRFLPGELEVDTVHVVNKDGDVSIFPLRNIRGGRVGRNAFHATLLADLDGAPLDITVDLTAQEILSDKGSIQFKAQLAAPEAGTQGSLSGQVTASGESLQFDVTVDAAFARVETFMKAFPEAPPLAGALALQGKLKGDLGSFSLSDARFELDNRPAYYFEASGSMVSQGSPDPGLALIASGELDSAKYFLRWLDVDLSPLGGIRASIALSGTVANPAIEQLTVVTTSSEGLWIALNGSSGPGSLGSTKLPPDTDFTLHAFAPSLAVLGPWLGQAPSVDPGPWELSAELRENDGALRVDNISGRLGRADGTRLQVAGEIAQVALDTATRSERASGIELAVSATSNDLQEAGHWLGADLPPGFSLDSKARISGTDAELILTEGSGQISHEYLTVDISKLSTRFSRDAAYTPANVRATLQALAPEASALGSFAALELPSLGALSVDAVLTYAAAQASLSDIRAALHGAPGDLLITGTLNDMTGAREFNLVTEVQTLNLDALLASFVPDLQPSAGLGNLRGSFALRGAQSAYTLDDLELNSPENAALNLHVSGEAQYREADWRTVASIRYASKDRDWLETLTGLPLKPVAGEIQLTADTHSGQLQADARLDETDLALSVELTHNSGTLDSLQAALSSAVVRLEDLGLQAAGTNANAADPQQGEDVDAGTRKTSVQQLLAKLPRYPVELSLQVGSLQGEITRFDDINVHVSGSGTTYLLDQFDFSYDTAPAAIRGIVDISLDPPGVSVAGQAESIPLNTLSRDLGIETDISGSLNLRGGVSAQGATGTELLQQLDGSMAFALENATVEGAAYDVLATGILTWLFSGAALEKSTFLDCTMAQFTLENGIARTDSLFVESPNMIATGIGSFDLPRRTLALTLTPRSKSRSIQFPSSISLRGDMTNPRTTVSPIAATLDISTEAMLFVPRLLVKIFGGSRSKPDTTRPCEVMLTQ
tara:strand:- start:31141 stop:34434 length:3294 start_codon:yes stop_codon:yes gene_type:complete